MSKIITTDFKYVKPLIPLNMKKVFFIVLHHVDAVHASPENIHEWHLENGWNGFAYNEYIRKDGSVYIGRGNNIGAHCSGMNSKSYGIAIEGNYNIEEKMPDVQFDSLIVRIKINFDKFSNRKEVCPHNRFVNTNCPGKYFPYQKIIVELSKTHAQEIFKNDLDILKNCGIINSPEYWMQNAVIGGNIRGEYARFLIHNFASQISKK